MGSGRKAKQARREREAILSRAEVLRESTQRIHELVQGFNGTLADLHAVVAKDPQALIPALGTKAMRRVAEHADAPQQLPIFAWRVGLAIAAADCVLGQLDAPWSRRKRQHTDKDLWLAELRGGLDTYARICWCVRFGYTIAAVVLTRRYIERWTSNIATSHDIKRLTSEDDRAYIDRVWSHYSQTMDGLSVGADWARLSELLHGRGVTWGDGKVRIDFNTSFYDKLRINNFVIRAAEVSLRQVRGCISVVARAADLDDQVHSYLQAPLRLYKNPPPPPEFLSVFFEPVDYDFVSSPMARTVSSWGDTYRRIVARGSRGPIDLTGFHSWMSIEERWARTVDDARGAFEDEAIHLGEQFDPAKLKGILILYRAITEMTDLTAGALPNKDQADALRTAAAALESAWILWLQDVDESLPAMRTVLESTARARVHRLKPAQAERLEARGSASTPHRWIEAAGWSRLNAFARALGEFSHMQERSRHTGSRSLLTNIQRNAHEGYEINTGRAHALEQIARMLAHETAATLDHVDTDLGLQFRQQVLFQTEGQAEVNLAAWLDHALAFRNHDFGSPNYVEE
jgi:hypothetical protein